MRIPGDTSVLVGGARPFENTCNPNSLEKDKRERNSRGISVVDVGGNNM